MSGPCRRFVVALIAVVVAATADPRAQGSWTREEGVGLAKSGFQVPAGRDAADVLLEMNALLSSPDPILRDDVAYTAAERWILRDKRVDPAGLRRLLDRWSKNLDAGLGEKGTDAVFGRSFSALNLSLIAAADLQSPFLEPAEVQAFFDRLLDYFAREQDLRGFDPERGWMHTVAHTADALKFLARNPTLGPGVDQRLLAAIAAKIAAADTVFAWGENDRMALALQSALRRPDASAEVLAAWTAGWVEAHRALWAKGPQVDPLAFARVENAKQVMRSLHAALSMETAATPTGTAAAKTILAALAKMR